MNYLPSRQRLFAVFIFISFCLHSLLLTISTSNQMTENRTYKGQQIIKQIVDEANNSARLEDKVSLSVIGKRYSNGYDVNRITFFDENGKQLVAIGSEPMKKGEDLVGVMAVNNSIVGRVQLTMKTANKAEIIKKIWGFVLFTLLIHLFLWLIYEKVRLPDQQQIIDKINENMRTVESFNGFANMDAKAESSNTTDRLTINDRLDSALNKQEPMHFDEPRNNKKVIIELADYLEEEKKRLEEEKKRQKKDQLLAVEEIDITENTEAFSDETLTEQEADLADQEFIYNELETEEVIDDEIDLVTDTDIIENLANQKLTDSDLETEEVIEDEIALATDITQELADQAFIDSDLAVETNIPPIANDIEQPSLIADIITKTDEQLLSSEDKKNALFIQKMVMPARPLILQFRYVDEYGLLDKLGPNFAKNYFDLCTKLLRDALNILSKDKGLQGIIVEKQPTFDKNGAVIRLFVHKNEQIKLLFASVILSVLYRHITESVYQRYRKIGEFALEMMIGISHIEQEEDLAELMHYHDLPQVLLLLKTVELQEIEKSIRLSDMPDVTDFFQREYMSVNEKNGRLSRKLQPICDQILGGHQ